MKSVQDFVRSTKEKASPEKTCPTHLAKRAGHAAARESSIGGGLAPTQIVMSMLTDSAPAVANF